MPSRSALAAVAVLGAGTAAAWTLARGDAPFARLGVTAPSAAVTAAVPVLRLVVVLAGGVCLGLLVVALVGRPAGRGARDLGAHAYRAVRRVAALAGAWAVAASAASLLLVVAATGGTWGVLAQPQALLQAMADLEEPAGMLIAAVAAGVVATILAVTLSWRSAAGALPVAALGVVAPVVTGQVASAGAGHDIATDAALLAALAGGVWLGVALSGVLDPAGDAATARRLVALARVAGAVTLAGTLAALAPLVRGQWFASAYGAWSSAQVALLVLALVAVLWRARPVVVAAVLIAAAAAGAVVATEPAPAYDAPVTIQEVLLGFDLPGAPTLWSLVAPGRLNLLLTVLVVVLAVPYVLAHRRVLARGDAWPRGRLLAWLGGCALLAWSTDSGLGSQSAGVFSAHMAVHMLVAMSVPVLLVLGGPITLALRALPAGDGGPREWVGSLRDAPLVRLLTHPLVSLVVFVGSLYALYLTSVFDAALPYHWGHQAMTLFFLVSGYLFFWPIVGVDAAPRPLPHVARLALVLASMPFHIVFGVVLIGADHVLGNQFYRQLALPWVPDLLADQALAGGVTWVAGEVPLLAVVVVLLVQWSRADERAAGRAGPDLVRGDGEDDELAAWQAMLTDLTRRR